MYRSRFVLAGAAVAAGFALAACGGNGEQPGVATAATGGTWPAASATAGNGVIEQYVAGMRKYVECMRGEGIDLPDPDAKGRIDYSVLGGTSKLKADPKFQAASIKCKDLQPAIPEELVEKPVPTPEQIRYARDYAKCMRANGEPDFPDPLADGNWPRRDNGGTTTDQQAAASLRAQQICAPVLEGRAPTTPDPKATGVG